MRIILTMIIVLITLSTVSASQYINITSPINGKIYTPDDNTFQPDKDTETFIHIIPLTSDKADVVNNVVYTYNGKPRLGNENLLNFQLSAFPTTYNITAVAYNINGDIIDTDSTIFTVSSTIRPIPLRTIVLDGDFEVIFSREALATLSKYTEISDINRLFKTYEQTLNYVKISKTAGIAATSEGNTTLVTIEITLTEPQHNFTVIEYVPKDLAPNASQYITVKVPEGATFEIIEDDPLMVWHFTEAKDKVKIEYEIKKEIDPKYVVNTKTITVSEDALKIYNKGRASRLLFYVIIPLISAALLIFAVIMISKHTDILKKR